MIKSYNESIELNCNRNLPYILDHPHKTSKN